MVHPETCFLCVVWLHNGTELFFSRSKNFLPPCSLEQFSALMSSPSSDLMWKLCTEVFLRSFFSVRWLLQQEQQFVPVLAILTKRVNQNMIESPHTSWFFSNADCTVCWREQSCFWETKTIFLPVLFFFCSLLLQGNSIWLHAAVSRCITQHLKENFWFC